MSIPSKVLAEGLFRRGEAGATASELPFSGAVRAEYQRKERASRCRWGWPSCISRVDSRPARTSESAGRPGPVGPSEGVYDPETGRGRVRSAQLRLLQLAASHDDKSIMGRLLGRLFVTFTTALILFISYTPQIFIIWPWYGRELSIELLALLVPFKYDSCNPVCTMLRALMNHFDSILVGILLYNYYLCVTTDPGGVPHNWVRHALTSTGFFTHAGPQEPELDDTNGYEVKKLSGAPRFCRMCDTYKPPRAHHCKSCKKYVSANYNPPL